MPNQYFVSVGLIWGESNRLRYGHDLAYQISAAGSPCTVDYGHLKGIVPILHVCSEDDLIPFFEQNRVPYFIPREFLE